MDLKIYKSNLVGKIVVPASKSYAHRLLIASFLSKKKITINNINESNDIMATLSILKSLGLVYKYQDNSLNFMDYTTSNSDIFDAGESGSTLRFMIPILMLYGKKVIIQGTKKLFSRGLDAYLNIFKDFNYHYELDDTQIVLFDQLRSGNYQLDVTKSSQYLTGLLMSLPLVDGDSTINFIGKLSSVDYIKITLDVLDQFNIKYQLLDNGIFIKGNQKYQIDQEIINVEGDYSNAAFLDAYNYLDGNKITLLGLNNNSLQGDIRYLDYFKELSRNNSLIDLENNIDLGPVLFSFAAMFNGGRFINIKRLRIKESNRIDDMLMELSKFGVTYELKDNELIIHKNPLHQPSSIVDPHNDHRIAMSLTILLSRFEGILINSECVDKSYPNYFKDLISIGLKVEQC